MLVVILIVTSIISIQAQEAKDVEIHYRYLFFSDECFEQFFGKEEIQYECVSDTISQTISILMVACAIFNQMPQIHKIVKNKSVQGISFDAYYTEFYLLSLICAYNIHKQTRFLLYGESVIVAIEYAIVLNMFIFYDKSMKKSDWLLKMMVFLIINIPLYIGYGPSWIFDSTIYINMVLSKYFVFTLVFLSRSFQIRLNYKNNNTGQMSLLTQLQNQSGSLARLFTLFNDKADIMYIFYIIEDNILATILTCQIVKTWRQNRKLKKTTETTESTCSSIKYDQI